MKYKSQKGSAEGAITVIITFLIIAVIVFCAYIIWDNIDIFLGKKVPEAQTMQNIEKRVSQSQSNEEYNGEVVNPNFVQETDQNTVAITNLYYYNQLNEPAKIIYDTINDNIQHLKNGNGTINFPDSLGKSIDKNGGAQIISDVFQSSWDALNLDRKDIFYVETSKLSLNTKTTSFFGLNKYDITLTPEQGSSYYLEGFSSASQIEQAESQINNIVEQITSAIQNGNRYEKVKYVHDWIFDNLEYDRNMQNVNNSNIYGAFIDHKAVCEGYADAFSYLMDRLNVPCVLVFGDAKDEGGNPESHAWNYVQLDDGEWYAVDVTWDDPILIGYGTISRKDKYRYFLKGSNEFFQTHYENGDVSGAGQKFKYPTISKNNYE